MSLILKVPSIKCDGCATAISEEIKVQDPDAMVKVDVTEKTVEVESNSLSESSIKQAITVIGHKVAE